MKRLLFLCVLLPLAVGCDNSKENEEIIDPNLQMIDDMIAVYGSFDSAAVAESLACGLHATTASYGYKDGKVISDNMVDWVGGGPEEYIFYDDGTVWKIGYTVPGTHNTGYEGRLYYVYRWEYDVATFTLRTYCYDKSYEAVIRAWNGDGFVCEGEICGNAPVPAVPGPFEPCSLLMVFEQRGDKERAYYIENSMDATEYWNSVQ